MCSLLLEGTQLGRRGEVLHGELVETPLQYWCEIKFFVVHGVSLLGLVDMGWGEECFYPLPF